MKNNSLEIEKFVKKILEEKKIKTSFIPGETLIPPSGKLLWY